MPKIKMDFYNQASGVVVTLSCEDEAEYLLSKNFLKELVGGPAGQPESGQPDFYYFKTEQQRDAFYKFRRGLRNGRHANPR